MELEQIIVNPENMLSVFFRYDIIMPHSMQPTVHIQIPFNCYVEFVTSQVHADVQLIDSVFDFNTYQKAIKNYQANESGMIKYCFFNDALRVATQELKLAVSRNRSATIITPQFEDSEDLLLNDCISKLQNNLNDAVYLKSFQDALSIIRKIGDGIMVDYQLLNSHNKAYFEYIALMFTELNYSKAIGCKVRLYNIR